MALKSTAVRYGTWAVATHWLAAVLILGLLASGFVAARTENLAVKAAILRLHVPVALLVLALTLLRLAWWWRVDAKPKPLEDAPHWQALSADVVHWFLYIVTLAMTVSGLAMMALSGAVPILFGGDSADLPDFYDYTPRVGHAIGLLTGLLALHAAAALHHHFVRRDETMRRMWFG